MAGKKRRVRVAHELSRPRRAKIKKALEEHESEARPEWDRGVKWGDIRLFRKRIKPGTMRTIHVPLLDVELGDSWPIPVTVISFTAAISNEPSRP